MELTKSKRYERKQTQRKKNAFQKVILEGVLKITSIQKAIHYRFGAFANFPANALYTRYKIRPNHHFQNYLAD
ncbi:MAG TPA: hypothetical protein VGB68_00245 [Pyrinomonadaceae bacterium]